MKSIRMVEEKRKKQIEEHGFTAEYDQQWTHGELVKAAVTYAMETLKGWRNFWPWHESYFKPDNDIEMLVNAAALLCAEIDRRLQARSYGASE